MNYFVTRNSWRSELEGSTTECSLYVTTSIKNDLLSTIILTLWCIHIIAAPYYLFASFLPQISDYILLLIFTILILYRELKVSHELLHLLITFGLFTVNVIVVNGIWATLLSDVTFYLYSSFYVFNFVVFFMVLVLYEFFGERFLRWTSIAIFLSLCIQVILALSLVGRDTFGGSDYRMIVFFNNPGQLAYHVVIVGSIFMVCSHSVCIPLVFKRLSPFVYLSVLYLCLIGLSRSGIVAALILLLIAAIKRPFILFLFAVALTLISFYGFTSKFEMLKDRQEVKSQPFIDVFLYDRGYDRLLNHPEYLFFGAGERVGKDNRFRSELYGEIHSTLATVVFGYGIIGLILFLGCFWFIVARFGVFSMLYFLPAACWGLTHNGLRHSEFWILLTIVACCFDQKRLSQKKVQ